MTINHQYLCLFTFLVSGFVQSAQAADGKSYPGSMCTKYTGSGSVDITSTAGIRNNSATNDLEVVCPVVKDQNGIQGVRINTIDPGSGAISCRVITHYRNDGQWFGQWTEKKSSGNGDPSYIKFDHANQDAFEGAHSYIRCTIPKKLHNGAGFWIISYHVTEW